jgi:hypothetical protein
LLKGNEFPNGRFPEPVMYYVLFPKNKVGDRVIAPDCIQIRQHGQWIKLSDYLYEPPVPALVEGPAMVKAVWKKDEALIRWNGWTD